MEVKQESFATDDFSRSPDSALPGDDREPLHAPRSRFELSKWYLDVVAEDGRAAILYCGAIRRGAFRFQAQSLFQFAEVGASASRFSFGRVAAPRIERDNLRWECAALGVAGEWRAQQPPLEAMILKTEEGAVRWSCVTPLARVALRLEAGQRVEGFGYAELLSMNIRPWRMDLRELRWGRFLGPSCSVLWIDWRGSETRQFAFWNGTRVAAARFFEDRVALEQPDATLELSDQRVLKSGYLSESSGPLAARLAEHLPGRMTRIHEEKYLSRGRLDGGGQSEVQGWVIHEVVRWP